MSLLLTILIILLVGALVFMAVRYILQAASVPQPFHNIILAIVILIIAVWIANEAGVLPPI